MWGGIPGAMPGGMQANGIRPAIAGFMTAALAAAIAAAVELNWDWAEVGALGLGGGGGFDDSLFGLSVVFALEQGAGSLFAGLAARVGSFGVSLGVVVSSGDVDGDAVEVSCGGGVSDEV